MVRLWHWGYQVIPHYLSTATPTIYSACKKRWQFDLLVDRCALAHREHIMISHQRGPGRCQIWNSTSQYICDIMIHTLSSLYPDIIWFLMVSLSKAHTKSMHLNWSWLPRASATSCKTESPGPCLEAEVAELATFFTTTNWKTWCHMAYMVPKCLEKSAEVGLQDNKNTV